MEGNPMERHIMSKEIKLPSGATVILKDPSTLRVRDRKNLIRASDSVEGELSRALVLGDALIAMLVESWSFDLVPPAIKLDSLDELEIPDYDALVEATKEAQSKLFPSVGNSVENEKNPKADSAN
jgi:hypothetical protein